MSTKDHVYSQIEKSGNLPTLPEILLKLLAACEDEDTPLSEIAEIIAKDPALSLRVLQLVNSAYYSFRHTFSSIEQAVVYLGANTIKNLAVTTSVHHVFAGKTAADKLEFDTGGFWYHSLMCATIARRLVLETASGNAEEAYLAGLLHDVGKLLLVSTFPKEYETSPQYSLSTPEELGKEAEQVGVNHCEAGAWLMRNWSLGSLLADAIQYHHEDIGQVSEAFPLVKIVYAANILAQGRIDPVLMREICGSMLDLDQFNLEGVVASAAKEVDEIALSMGIRIRPPKVPKENTTLDTPGIEQESVVEDPLSAAADSTVGSDIANRIKNVSLLSSFQEELMLADDQNAMFGVFERAVTILFMLDKVLFFLPDRDTVLLRGRASTANSLYQTSRGLTLSLKQNASLVVQSYRKGVSPGYMSADQHDSSLADQQILDVFGCSTACLMPLRAEKANVGVMVIGLPGSREVLSDGESQVLKVFAQQLSLRLHLHEEKERKAEAVRKERMAAISLTARKFAHEINNPLGIIGNYLMTLKLKLANEDNVTEDLDIIDEEIRRISSMVSQMEMFSQAPFSEVSMIDLNEVIRDIVQLAKPSLFDSTGTVVSFIPGQDIPLVTTSRDAVKQIIINLLKNAAEAMENGGRVVVRTKKRQVMEPEKIEGVDIIVSDSGPGLPEVVMKNLYKPFVTTKQNGHSGLGLSIVQKAVTEIGGKLSCDSSSSEGTTFTIFLPARLSADTSDGERK